MGLAAALLWATGFVTEHPDLHAISARPWRRRRISALSLVFILFP